MGFSRERPALAAALVALFAAIIWMAGSASAGQEPKQIKEGDPAPDIDLPATQIEKVLPDKKDAKTLHLKDLQGKKNVVLYFFPKALTRG
jgi:hypothetical protein